MTYKEIVKGKEAAIERAKELLLQNYPPKGDYRLASTTTEAEDSFCYTLSLLPSHVEEEITEDERLRTYPSALVQDISESSNSYRVYVYTYDRLPFYVKQIAMLPYTLPEIAPPLKPEAPLSVEVAHTAQGRAILNEDYVETYNERVVAFINTEKEDRIYTLFDCYGELTVEEIKKELDKGVLDFTFIDVEGIINNIEGKTYTSEKEHVARLSTLCGEEAVKRYLNNILIGYHFYKALYFVDYLEYMLRYTEDYGALAAQLTELKEAYGLKEVELEIITQEAITPVEVALARYLYPYYEISDAFDGLTYKRIAEYLNAPHELIERLKIDKIYKEAGLLDSL